MVNCPRRRVDPSPPVSRNASTISASGAVEIRASPVRPASRGRRGCGDGDRREVSGSCTGGPGRSRRRGPFRDQIAGPESADQVDRLFEHVEPLPDSGQGVPVTCSFRFSPVPRPSVNRSGSRDAVVAAACATMAVHTDRRARHRGHDRDLLGLDGEAAEHAPHEWALPLPRGPRVEVIRRSSGSRSPTPPRSVRRGGGRRGRAPRWTGCTRSAPCPVDVRAGSGANLNRQASTSPRTTRTRIPGGPDPPAP